MLAAFTKNEGMERTVTRSVLVAMSSLVVEVLLLVHARDNVYHSSFTLQMLTYHTTANC